MFSQSDEWTVKSADKRHCGEREREGNEKKMIKTSDLIDLFFLFPPPNKKKKSLEILPTAFSPGREQFQSPLPDPNRSRREEQSEKEKEREKDDDFVWIT